MILKIKLKMFLQKIGGLKTVLFCFLILGISTGALFFLLNANKKNQKIKNEHFIVAETSEEFTEKLLNQKEENYFIIGYYGNNADQILLRECKKIKNEKIGWYAIDINKYSGFVSMSQNVDPQNGKIFNAYSLTNNEAQYWLVTSNYIKNEDGFYETDESGNKKIAGKTFKLFQTGYYNAAQLEKEILWVQENGTPISEIGQTKVKTGKYSLLWNSIKITQEEEKKYIEIQVEAKSLVALENEQPIIEYDKLKLETKGVNATVVTTGNKTLDPDSVATLKIRFEYVSSYDINDLKLTYVDDTGNIEFRIFRPLL